MYGYVNPQAEINKIEKQMQELDRVKAIYQQQMQPQQPINNIINTTQPQNVSQNTQNNLLEWRVLNENEQVDNLYVQRETLFVGDNMMVKKYLDGKLEKWEIKKIYPIDPKDKKINELEEKIKEMEEKLNEHSKFNKSIENVEQPNTNDNGNVESTTKASRKPISTKTE